MTKFVVTDTEVTHRSYVIEAENADEAFKSNDYNSFERETKSNNFRQVRVVDDAVKAPAVKAEAAV